MKTPEAYSRARSFSLSHECPGTLRNRSAQQLSQAFGSLAQPVTGFKLHRSIQLRNCQPHANCSIPKEIPQAPVTNRLTVDTLQVNAGNGTGHELLTVRRRRRTDSSMPSTGQRAGAAAGTPHPEGSILQTQVTKAQETRQSPFGP